MTGWHWTDQAACKNTSPADFFPTRDDNHSNILELRAMTQRAKAICATCTVRQECLEYAIVNEPLGVWGGRSPKERQDIRKERAAAGTFTYRNGHNADKECGTEAGYWRHTRRKEKVCDPCREARQLAHRLRQAAAKQQAS